MFYDLLVIYVSDVLLQVLRPRGLLDSKVSALHSLLVGRCDELLDSLVIFELVDMCREFLTENNAPACKCAICLLDIVDEDAFVKTECYHYFHSCCLGDYVRSASEAHEEYLRENPAVPGMKENRELVISCAVCREVIRDVRTDDWARARRPRMEAALDDFKVTPELEEMQAQMRRLYLKQRDNGCLIDVEEESKKFLVSTAASNTNTAADAQKDTLTEKTSESARSFVQPQQQAQPPPKIKDYEAGVSKKGGRGRHAKRGGKSRGGPPGAGPTALKETPHSNGGVQGQYPGPPSVEGDVREPRVGTSGRHSRCGGRGRGGRNQRGKGGQNRGGRDQVGRDATKPDAAAAQTHS